MNNPVAKSYNLLPFRFERIDKDSVFISNECGEYIFTTGENFKKLVNYELDVKSEVFSNLKEKQVVTDTEIAPMVDMLATKYRTKKAFLNGFTSLHMVVPTLRCNSNCIYCQVSRKEESAKSFTMSKHTAKKIVDTIFMSPSNSIKIEFQGGEPLLAFDIVKYIIEYAERKNIFKKKHLEFVICSNLTLMDKKKLGFFKNKNICISTSLDGHKALHNRNRPLQTTPDSYDVVIEKINLCRSYLGKDRVGVLMTTSRYSLGSMKQIIDEYVKQGFNAIFLRSLNPFGFARQERHNIGYDIEDFIVNYKEALDYIIKLNIQGIIFIECFASLLLTRILTPFSTGFVDMQSPAGVGISGVIYNYDGNVYVSDEARMLASMGDNKFLMGNVNEHSYQELFNSDFMHNLISSACLECLPGCSYCAFQPYCGADPVRNYSEQGDIIGHRPSSEVCKKNKAIIKYLLELIEKNDEKINKVFWSWVTKRSIL